MVACELDAEVSGDVMGWKLPAWQALLLHRVLPSCGGLLLYLTQMCFDSAVIYEHFKNGDEGVAAFSIILMVMPALLSMLFTLASPPPGLQTEASAFTLQVEKSDLWWIFMQIINFVAFPIAAIGRYCHQIFWWIEAVCAAKIADEERTRNALLRVHAPSPLELYLFLQAFIHAAPHAIINILEMMGNAGDPVFDKVSVQGVSIIASTFRMASTATLYRRFEREKICGRKYPWNVNNEVLHDNVTNENIEKENTVKQQQVVEEENIYEPLVRQRSNAEPNPIHNGKVNSDLIQFSPRVLDEQEGFYYTRSSSDVGSDYLVPTTHIDQAHRNTEADSEDEYARPVSIIDRVAPRRRDRQYTIEKVEVFAPPAMPAPRIGSIALWAEKMVENAESIPTWLSAPPRRRHYDEEVLDEPDLPRHVPRKFMRGLEPQDATAALVNFLGWHMFFISRLLSIAALINFFPVVAIIVIFSHYQIMLLILIVPQATTVRRGFYVFLAFIYLFCLMEFKIRFRHVRAWHVFWMVVCSMETIVFTALWATIDNDLTSWWKHFIVLVIFGSLLLSYMCLLVYFVILKPAETVIYIDESKAES